MFRAYIKDALNLSGKTKCLIPLKSGNVKVDRLTSASSSFEAFKVPSNVDLGDILILINDKGKTLYNGVITSIKDTTIATTQALSVLKGSFNYSYVNSSTIQNLSYIEQAIKLVIDYYKSGAFYNSSYTDTLVSTKMNFSTSYTNSTSGKLETDKDEDGNDENTIKDMESWLYDIYKTYGICVEFTFPLGETQPSLTVKKNSYSYLKVSDGFECISEITPTTSTQTTNRLIIFAKDKTYRDTYVLTKSGVVAHPSTNVGRPIQVNTKVVYSDDTLNDIVKANLSDTLYNHKVEFNVALNNNFFDFDNLKLDTPIKVYSEANYYDTIITSQEFSFSEDVISNLKIICGYVRSTLTDKLKLGYVK